MTAYNLTAKCVACGKGINEGCPVLVDTEMCPTCTFGECDANLDAMDEIINGDCKVITTVKKKRKA